MQCQMRLEISRANNIGCVVESSDMAFRPAPPYGGLLVLSTDDAISIQNSEL